MKVYLSPSSQFGNKYSGVSAVEAEICNDIAKYTESALKRNGIEVRRGDANSTTMEGRVTDSNLWGADYHIPIHTNAGGGEGTEVFAWPDTIDNVVKEIYNSVSAASPGKDRGIKDGREFYEVNSTTAICCYIECEFHDTYGIWIYNHRKELGEAIARGFCKGINKTFVEESKPEDNKKMYRVQVGAFIEKKNAEDLANKLKSMGYDTIIK